MVALMQSITMKVAMLATLHHLGPLGIVSICKLTPAYARCTTEGLAYTQLYIP